MTLGTAAIRRTIFTVQPTTTKGRKRAYDHSAYCDRSWLGGVDLRDPFRENHIRRSMPSRITN